MRSHVAFSIHVYVCAHVHTHAHVPALPKYCSMQSATAKCNRLSIALCVIAAPTVLVLDEPTTGLDPLNRQTVWRLIQELKQSRVLVLTTHDMEEADLLGDSIAIMSKGLLKAHDTPMHLKNSTAASYQIEVFCHRASQAPELESQLAERFATALRIRDSIDTSKLILKLTSLEDVGPASLFIADSPIVKEWGLRSARMQVCIVVQTDFFSVIHFFLSRSWTVVWQVLMFSAGCVPRALWAR